MRFGKGEIAIWGRNTISNCDVPLWQEVEIFAVGPFPAYGFADPTGYVCDQRAEYIVTFNGKYVFCDEINLRKRRPPESYKGQYDTNSRTFRDVMNNPGRKIEAPDMAEVYREIKNRIEQESALKG
jgi:hypothetical protein